MLDGSYRAESVGELEDLLPHLALEDRMHVQMTLCKTHPNGALIAGTTT
jgi:hypothetical protein